MTETERSGELRLRERVYQTPAEHHHSVNVVCRLPMCAVAFQRAILDYLDGREPWVMVGDYPAPPDTGPSGLDGIDCPDCGGRGWTFGADPLPSGEPGEPYQVQCGSCEGTGRLTDPSGLDVEAARTAFIESLYDIFASNVVLEAVVDDAVRRFEAAIQESRAGGGLDPLLIAQEAIGLFIEYRDQHGHDEATARTHAVREVVEGAAYAKEAGS